MIAVLWSVLAGVYDTFPGDEAALTAFQRVGSPWLDFALGAVTRLGDPWAAAVMVVGTVIALLFWRRWGDSIVLALILAPVLANYGLKELVARPRPGYSLMGLEETGFSFPSGHSVLAVYYFGFLIYLMGELVANTALRSGIRLALVLLVLAMGASRVYLGAHWPSDVAGAYLLGGLALLAAVWLRGRGYLSLSSRWKLGPRSP